MKNIKPKLFGIILGALAMSATFLAGCANKNESANQKEKMNEALISKAIQESTPTGEVVLGEFETSLSGDYDEVDENAKTYTSSTIFDMPRDAVINVVYDNEDNMPLQSISSLLTNIVNSNKELKTISIQDRGGHTTSNNLLATDGDKITVTKPGGYEYGEVYQITIDDEYPNLCFENKSKTIRTLTIEIEDDPSELDQYDEKDIKANITHIDLKKVNNKKQNFEEQTYSFEYDGQFPDLHEGDVFYATVEDNPNKYLDFYGVFDNQEVVENVTVVNYHAPEMSDIYDNYRLKTYEPMDLSDADILLNEQVLIQQFKQSTLPRGLAHALENEVDGRYDVLKGIFDNFKVKVNFNIVNNRVTTRFSAGVYGVKLKEAVYLSVEFAHEEVTDYYIDADVKIRTKWIFPVGIDYKFKCVEDKQESNILRADLSVSFAPSFPSEDQTFKQKLLQEMEKLESGDKGSILHNFKENPDLKPSTSGSRTTWPLFQADLYYFAPITIRFKAEFYLDAGFQLMGMFKKEVHSTKIDFNFTNMSGQGTDASNEILGETNWMIVFAGSVHFEVGFRISLNISLFGMYDYLKAAAYAEFYINATAQGIIVMDIKSEDGEKDFTGFICLDLSVSCGLRVGLEFKILVFEENVNKLLWSDYLFRIKYDNGMEHWSSISEDTIDMEGQTLSIKDTNALWVECFDQFSYGIVQKKFKGDEQFSIFSGILMPKALVTDSTGYVFTYTPTDPSLLEIDNKGTIHVPDGTAARFTTTFKIHVSNWCGYISDRIITVNYVASDAHEVYLETWGNGLQYHTYILLGEYRPNATITLPDAPDMYAHYFQAYGIDGDSKLKHPGDPIIMGNETLYINAYYIPLDWFDVYFYDGKENLVAVDRVLEGTAAIAPSDRMRDRYTDLSKYYFLNWDKDFTYVKSNLNVYGVYVSIREAQ